VLVDDTDVQRTNLALLETIQFEEVAVTKLRDVEAIAARVGGFLQIEQSQHG